MTYEDDDFYRSRHDTFYKEAREERVKEETKQYAVIWTGAVLVFLLFVAMIVVVAHYTTVAGTQRYNAKMQTLTACVQQGKDPLQCRELVRDGK